MPPELETHVDLRGRLSPSEDGRKVMSAMKNVLKGSRTEGENDGKEILFRSDDRDCLDEFRRQLRDRGVRAAARRLMLVGVDGGTTTLMLNRQAAFSGVIALCSSAEESPLGPLYLTIRSRKLDAVIDWLTAYESG